MKDLIMECGGADGNAMFYTHTVFHIHYCFFVSLNNVKNRNPKKMHQELKEAFAEI